MKCVFQFLATAFIAATVPLASAAEIGLREIDVTVPERGAAVSTALWYPAAGGGEEIRIGENGIFQGVVARANAAIAPGRKQVIVLSHGGLRSAPGVESWIAAALAERGFVVAVPHAPKVKAAEAPAEYWLRPADMSAALTALEHHPPFAGNMDTGNAAALGFFLGGTAALSLAGVELDQARLAAQCDGETRNPDCSWFSRGGVDLHRVDFGKLQRPVRDPRVKSVIAVNPELMQAITAAPVAAPAHLVTLGLESRAAVPFAGHDALAGASPFDAFSLCKPGALAILRGEGEDESLCADGAEPRAVVHARLVDLIVAKLTEQASASQ